MAFCSRLLGSTLVVLPLSPCLKSDNYQRHAEWREYEVFLLSNPTLIFLIWLDKVNFVDETEISRTIRHTCNLEEDAANTYYEDFEGKPLARSLRL